MNSLSDSELLLYVGIGLMAIAIVVTLSGIIVFCHTGKKMREMFKREYGDLRQ